MQTNNFKKSASLKHAEITLKQIEEAPRFKIIYDSVYLNTNLNGDEMALLYLLITSAPTYKPNYKTIEERLKIPHKRIIKAIQTLKKEGYLFIERKGTNGAQWTITQKPIKELKTDEDINRKNIYLLHFNPLNVMENLKQNKISIEQAQEQITLFMQALKTKEDENDIKRRELEAELIRNTKFFEE